MKRPSLRDNPSARAGTGVVQPSGQGAELKVWLARPLARDPRATTRQPFPSATDKAHRTL
jgi:hypothetical protein